MFRIRLKGDGHLEISVFSAGILKGLLPPSQLDFAINKNPLRGLNLSYKFTYHDLDLYYKGDKTLNTTYHNHAAEFSYSDMNWLSFKFQAGLRYEHYNYTSVLSSNGSNEFPKQNFFNYFATVHFETLDRQYFPTKGVSIGANYTLYTDNFTSYNGHFPFSALTAKFLSVLPATSHFSIIPSIYGRVLIGEDAAFPYLNMVGGETEGRYLDHQLPFAGINHVDMFDNAMVLLRLQLRQRIGTNHYISLIGNCGVHDDNFFDILKGKYVWGGTLGYYYDSMFGPMNMTFGLSNWAKSFKILLNLGYYF